MHRKHSMTALALLLLSMTLAAPARAAILRVKADAPGPVQDGATWATAYRTVQAAVDAGPAGNEVWIARGTYVGKIDAFWAVHLYGGFAGTETAREQRDPKARPTVLDGNQAGPVIAFTTFDESGTQGTVDGLTIRNGRAEKGAGIRSEIPRLTVANCTITGNTAGDPYTHNIAFQGGGLWAKGSEIVVSGSRIEGNRAHGRDGEGGGLWVEADTAIIGDNTVRDNNAQEGGGIRVQGTTATIERNVITGNGGGAIEDFAAGGGIATTAASCRIANNLVAHNSVASEMWSYGGGIYATSGATIVNNTIVDNSAWVFFPTFPSVAAGGGTYGGGLVANNIVAYNSAGITGTSNLSVPGASRRNIIYGYGAAATYGDILADPWFVSTDPGQAESDYRLLPNSPAIDAGDDSLVLPGETDLLGRPRIAGAHVDIGAYEFTGYEYPTGAITMSDATRALRIAAGLERGHTLDEARLDRAGEPGRIDLADAIHLLRQAL